MSTGSSDGLLADDYGGAWTLAGSARRGGLYGGDEVAVVRILVGYWRLGELVGRCSRPCVCNSRCAISSALELGE